MRRLFLPFFLLFAVAVCAVPLSGYALESAPAKAEFSSVQLVLGKVQPPASADAAAGKPAGASLQAGVEIKLEGEWKTYWRSPGDAGVPMTVTLESTAANIAAVTIQWPYATRFVEEWGLEVFGYKHQVLIPITLQLIDPKQPTQADLKINYAVCSDICINEEHKVSLAIPVDYKPDAKQVKKLAAAQVRIPLANGGNGLKVESAVIEEEDADKNKGILVVDALIEKGKFTKPELFIEGPAGLRFPLPEVKVEAKGKKASFRVVYELSPPARSLNESELTLTLVQGDKAVEAKLKAEKKLPKTAAAEGYERAKPQDKSLWESIKTSGLVQNAISWW